MQASKDEKMSRKEERKTDYDDDNDEDTLASH
jgi:hypothetical protein